MRTGNIISSVVMFGAAISLAACNELTHSKAAQILDGQARGRACVTSLNFTKGGFAHAKANRLFTVAGGGLVAATLKVADAPSGDQWVVSCLMGMCGAVVRTRHSNLCLPGHVEINSIADAPFAQGNGSYKAVYFTEVVDLPTELARLAPYVYTKYKKSIIFQKADTGWRVLQ